MRTNPFYLLLTNPLFYKTRFLIGMPESQQMSLFKAMKDHSVFLCPNKHLYFVGDCGATNETAKCYHCNAQIGNDSRKAMHHAADGNKKLGVIGENGEIIPDEWWAQNGGTASDGASGLSTEHKAVGFIDTSDADDDCVRGLPEIAVCIIRCFILCSLWLHHSERSSEFPSNAMEFMYPHRVAVSVANQVF